MAADLVERAPEIVEPWLAGGTPLGRAGFPADIANAALWHARRRIQLRDWTTLVVDGGLYAGFAVVAYRGLEKLIKGALPRSSWPGHGHALNVLVGLRLSLAKYNYS
jgi:hypothetical protein